MAHRLPPRNAKGRFTKRGGHRKHARKHIRRITARSGRRVRVTAQINPRRRHRRHVSNPRRHTRRVYMRNARHHRRHYRSNPSFKNIFSKPTLKNVGFAVVGIAGTPMLSGFIARYLPATISTNKWANYALKGASAYGLSLITDKVAGKEAGRAVLIGGLAYTALGIIADFFPTLFGISSAGTSGVGRYLRAQPLLAGGMGMYPFRGTAGPITAGAPNRLDPASRF